LRSLRNPPDSSRGRFNLRPAVNITEDDRLRKIVNHLQERGHRITPQRYSILKVLVESREHPSAEAIYRELGTIFPTMSLATVYKTLALLKQEGEVLELGFSDLGNRYDGNKPYPHPHVICTDCGAVVDPPPFDLEKITREIIRATGFTIMTHRLDFYGLCPACQEKSQHFAPTTDKQGSR
jgi:Fur family transcriptional regulator, peroxide stress response regulator